MTPRIRSSLKGLAGTTFAGGDSLESAGASAAAQTPASRQPAIAAVNTRNPKCDRQTTQLRRRQRVIPSLREPDGSLEAWAPPAPAYGPMRTSLGGRAS